FIRRLDCCFNLPSLLCSSVFSRCTISQVIGPSQPIVATLGDSIILPSYLKPVYDAMKVTVEWARPDLDPRFVYVSRIGQDLEHMKNPAYKGRTSMFIDELKHGNISLKLSKVKQADAGRYRCFIPETRKDTFMDLFSHSVQTLILSCAFSGALPAPVITLEGTDGKGGVVLQCESAGWYPEPELLWLDGEGKLLSAGPPETVRGPDDLYTVSSRVTQVISDRRTPGGTFQLFLGDPEAFPGQLRNIILLAGSGSAPESPPRWTCSEDLQRKPCRRHPNQMSKTPQLTPFDTKEQRLYSELPPDV
uniref:Butyrophilin subfamily 3 member A2-like Ig-C domain-containing protein n=1 Tax=Stegastes partitus TaxID=144197 RepID=A0A3B5AAH1_9TELE